jgi:Holliday junction resolvase RusA-like endonuclease
MKLFAVETPLYPEKKRKGTKPGAPRKISWRRQLHSAILKEKTRTRYPKIPAEQKVEVTFVIYLQPNLLARMDADNIAKDLLDALQGRLAGEKKSQQTNRHKALIANDSQVFRLHIEKRPIAADNGLGQLTVSPVPS